MRPWDREPQPPVRPPLDALAPPEQLGDGEELVAGRRPVEEAFSARRPAHRLLVVPERRSALDQIVLHATALRIPVVEVEGGTLTALCGFDGHQGVALVVEPRRWASLDDVLARARERGEPPLLLVLDSLEDPQNVGTLLRSAEACGVHGVLFPVRRSAPISPAAVKASAGAVEHLLLVPLDDLAGGLADLHGRGLRLVGADEEAPLSFREADLRGPIALVVGSEGRGISNALRRRIDLTVRIPMRGRVASLNAAVAGSVLLFEASAQRGGSVTPDVAADRQRGNADATQDPDEVDADDAVPGGEAEPAAQPEAVAQSDEPADGPSTPGASSDGAADAAPAVRRTRRSRVTPTPSDAGDLDPDGGNLLPGETT